MTTRVLVERTVVGPGRLGASVGRLDHDEPGAVDEALGPVQGRLDDQ